MAQRTVIHLTDDIDGTHADTTVQFAFEGKSYEIDLSEAHAAELAEAFAPYVKAARRTDARNAPRGGRNRTAGSNPKAVREWAKGHGFHVSERGRIPAEVAEAYKAAIG